MGKHLEEYRKQGIEKRYAYEWYMKEADEFYWGMTKERIAAEVEPIKARLKKITALAVTSTVIAVVAIIVYAFALLHK